MVDGDAMRCEEPEVWRTEWRKKERSACLTEHTFESSRQLGGQLIV